MTLAKQESKNPDFVAHRHTFVVEQVQEGELARLERVNRKTATPEFFKLKRAYHLALRAGVDVVSAEDALKQALVRDGIPFEERAALFNDLATKKPLGLEPFSVASVATRGSVYDDNSPSMNVGNPWAYAVNNAPVNEQLRLQLQDKPALRAPINKFLRAYRGSRPARYPYLWATLKLELEKAGGEQALEFLPQIRAVAETITEEKYNSR